MGKIGCLDWFDKIAVLHFGEYMNIGYLDPSCFRTRFTGPGRMPCVGFSNRMGGRAIRNSNRRGPYNLYQQGSGSDPRESLSRQAALEFRV